MMAWWNAREIREKWILLIGGVIALAVVLFQFAWLPSQEYRQRAERAHAAAALDLSLIRAQEAQAGQTISSSNQPIQSVITRLADGYGLTLSRLIPAGDAGMNVFIDAADPLLIYAWLLELERAHGIRVGATSTLRRNADQSTVSANLYVSRGG